MTWQPRSRRIRLETDAQLTLVRELVSTHEGIELHALGELLKGDPRCTWSDPANRIYQHFVRGTGYAVKAGIRMTNGKLSSKGYQRFIWTSAFLDKKEEIR
jgi:hypothetical protein